MKTYRSLRSLRDQARQIQPDPAWVRSARQTLLMQAKNAMPTGAVAERERESFVSVLLRRMMDALRGPALAVLSVLAVVLGGSIASVSASEQSLPGDVLYPVKLVTEQARLVMTPGKPEKVRLKSEFTKRRVDELKIIVNTDDPKKDERVGKAADVLKSDLDTLRRQLSDVQKKEEPRETAEAARIVDKQVVEVARTLAETTNGLSIETKEKVDAAKAQAVDVGIKALEVLMASNVAGGDGTVSDSELAESVTAHTEIARETVASAKATVVVTSSTIAIVIPSGQTSSTKPVATSTSALQLVQDAEASLNTVNDLLQGKQMDQLVSVLKDATMKSLTVQKQVVQDAAATSSTTSGASVLGTSTSTAPQAASGTSTTP